MIFAFIKARIGERSTWMFWGAGLAAAAALPTLTWQVLGGVCLFVAGIIPDKGSG